MRAQKRKKAKDDSPMVKPVKNTNHMKYQFNISYDNLRCFMNPSKSIRANKRRTVNKSKQHVQKNVINHLMAPEKHQSKLIVSHSPDLTREASNCILKKIQSQGINCNWGEDTMIELTRQQEQEDKLLWTSLSASFSSKSYASTTDLYSNIGKSNSLLHINYDYYSSHMGQHKMRGYDPSVFDIDVDNIENDPRTTIMIKNVPNKYSVQDLSAEIDAVLENSYDFLYLPCDLKNQCNVGYGFINLVDTCYLSDFHKEFHTKKWLKFRSEKICMLTYARLQGLESLINHFQNSKVLNQKDKKYRPIIRQMDKIQHLIKKQQEGK